MNRVIQCLVLLLFGTEAYAEAFSAIGAFISSYGGYIAAAVSAASAISSAQQQKASAKYNEKVANQQAVAAQQEASANAERQRRSAQKNIGAMQAQYAASGVSLEGSPLEVLEQSARNAELDRLSILWGGQTRAQGYSATANLERARGENAMTSGYLSAAGSLFSAAGKTAGKPSGAANNAINPVGVAQDSYGQNVSDSFSRITMQRVE